MNLKTRIYLLSLTLAFPCLSMYGQDLDPTVVVNREYEGKLVEVHKPSLKMAVPDSVMRFEYDFDYSISDNPYKGSYEFKPYQLAMDPSQDIRKTSSFYLRAGAGYQLHPELDAVWSVSPADMFRLDIYAFNRSYIGKYRTIAPRIKPDGTALLADHRMPDGSDVRWSGYDLMSRAGLKGRYDWDKAALSFDVGYYGLAVKDMDSGRGYDAVDAIIGLESKNRGSSAFTYSIAADYRFAEDKLVPVGQDRDYLSEQLFGFDADLGALLSSGDKLMFGTGLDIVSYSAFRGSSACLFRIVPHYVIRRNRFDIDLGIRLSFGVRPEGGTSLYQGKGQYVYPDITFRFAAIPDAMRLYAQIGGGDRLDTYSELISSDHHADLGFGRLGSAPLDLSVERVNAVLGMEGRISSRFSYNLRAGYSDFANAALPGVVAGLMSGEEALRSGGCMPAVGYAPYRRFFAAVDWDLRTESVRFDGAVTYVNAWGLKDGSGLFAPAMLSGDVSVEYDWKNRVFAGVDCIFSTARRGSILNLFEGNSIQAKIPGYIDLGANVEYAIDRKLSVWVRGGNLLGMTIQRNPLYAEDGIYFTAGITLKI